MGHLPPEVWIVMVIVIVIITVWCNSDLLSMSVTRLVAVVEEEDTRTAITLCSSWLHTP